VICLQLRKISGLPAFCDAREKKKKSHLSFAQVVVCTGLPRNVKKHCRENKITIASVLPPNASAFF